MVGQARRETKEAARHQFFQAAAGPQMQAPPQCMGRNLINNRIMGARPSSERAPGGNEPVATPEPSDHQDAQAASPPEPPSQPLESSAPEPANTMGSCRKCKERPAEFLLRGQYPQCYLCLEGQLLNKLRGTLKAPGGLDHGGALALAFSGGPSSSLLLHLLNSVRDPSVQWYDKQKMAFGLTLLHVAEDGAEAAAAAALAARVAPEGVDFLAVPLSAVFEGEETDAGRREARLAELLAVVADPTGAVDLRGLLRLRVLLERCQQAGCAALALGDNAAATAAAAVAAVVKGGGYAVPAAAARVDRRHVAAGGPALLYPLREVPEEECDLACAALGLPRRAPRPGGDAPDKHDINALAEIFVQNVLKHNPGAVNNINSTVARLEAFSWSEGGDGAAEAAEALCPLCFAPLADDEVRGAAAGDYGELAGVCENCVHQMFGGPGGSGAVMTLLPRGMAQAIQETAEAWARVRSETPGEEAAPGELRRRLGAALP